MKVEALNNPKLKNLSLNDEIFGINPKREIILRVVNWQLAKKQSGSHKVKSRSEVKSTTAKMFRQKGTGRARHGASSVVQFRGGGVVHGPVVRFHSHKLPKKIRVLGLKSILSQKANENNIKIFDLHGIKNKTSDLIKLLHKNGKKKFLIVCSSADKTQSLKLAINNIPLTDMIFQIGLNVYDILNKDQILFTELGLKDFENRILNAHK